MTVLLVRHADAGDRSLWTGDDRVRPLNRRGEEQAAKLVALLAPFRPQRILSSPWLRCVDSVRPLATALGLDVEETDGLAEGAGAAAIDLVAKLAEDVAVLCTHGDVIPDVLDALAAGGVGLGPAPRLKKGSTWVLEPGPGPAGITKAWYLPPPE